MKLDNAIYREYVSDGSFNLKTNDYYWPVSILINETDTNITTPVKYSKSFVRINLVVGIAVFEIGGTKI